MYSRKLASLHCIHVKIQYTPRPHSVSLQHSAPYTDNFKSFYDNYSLWPLPSPLSPSSWPYILQPQCCGSGSDGSVIKWTPGSGSVILLLRIRILTIYQRFKKCQKKVKYLINNIKWFTTNLTTYLRHQNVQVGSGSGHKKVQHLVILYDLLHIYIFMPQKSVLQDYGFADPDPWFRIMDPRLRIRKKYLLIQNTAVQTDPDKCDVWKEVRGIIWQKRKPQTCLTKNNVMALVWSLVSSGRSLQGHLRILQMSWIKVHDIDTNRIEYESKLNRNC